MPSRTIPSRNYSAGTRTVDFPTAVTKRFDSVLVEFTRESWPLTEADTVLTIVIESSFDNWVTTAEVARAGFGGGTILQKDGTPLTVASFGFSTRDAQGLPLFRGGGLRAIVTNTVALRTAITLTFGN